MQYTLFTEMQCIAELPLPGDSGSNHSHDIDKGRCRKPKILCLKLHGVIQWYRIFVVAHILHEGLVVRVFTAVEKRSCSTDSVISVQLG